MGNDGKKEFPHAYLLGRIRIDVGAEFARLDKKFRLLDHVRDLWSLQKAVDQASHDARQANRLYLLAREQFELFEKIEYAREMGILRREALIGLGELKKDRDCDCGKKPDCDQCHGSGKIPKLIPKQISDAMVESFVARAFPERYEPLVQRHVELETVMNDMRCFAELWADRCATLRKLLELARDTKDHEQSGY